MKRDLWIRLWLMGLSPIPEGQMRIVTTDLFPIEDYPALKHLQQLDIIELLILSHLICHLEEQIFSESSFVSFEDLMDLFEVFDLPPYEIKLALKFLSDEKLIQVCAVRSSILFRANKDFLVHQGVYQPKCHLKSWGLENFSFN